MVDTFDEAFAYCITALENQEESLGDCLARYPQFEQELAELLALIRPLNAMGQLSPRRQFMENAGQRLVSKLPDQNTTFKPQVRHKWGKSFKFSNLEFSMAQIMLAVGLLLSLLTGGTAYAADAAGPGDLLWELDLALEQLELYLSPNAEAAVETGLENALERLEEAQTELGDGEAENAVAALDAYGVEIADLAQMIADEQGLDQLALAGLINQALMVHQDVLANLQLPADVPVQAQQAIQNAIDVASPPFDLPAGPPEDSDLPGEVDLPDESDLPGVPDLPEQLPAGPPDDVEIPADAETPVDVSPASPGENPVGPPDKGEIPGEGGLPGKVPSAPPDELPVGPPVENDLPSEPDLPEQAPVDPPADAPRGRP